MNKDRRKALSALADELNGLHGKIDDIRSQAETLRDEEQDYFDAMPENLQQGDRGQTAEEAIGYIESAVNALDEALSQLNDASRELENAAGL